jgi:aminoglycoside phosphotransferase (APT) family kinase protein
MSDLGIYLQNILLSLQQDVAPAVTTDRARTSVKAISHMLARMVSNLEIAELGGQGPATVEAPDACYGGAAALQAAAEEATRQLSRHGSVSALIGLVRWEHDVLGPLQRLTMDRIVGSSPGVQPALPTQSDTAARLEAYLQRHFGAGTRVTGFNDLFGGRSKVTSLARVSSADGREQDLAVRRDAAMNLTGGRSVIGEYPILKVLHAHGIKVPRPVLAESDSSVLGSPFILVERLPGACGEIYRTPESIALVKDVAVQLAKLHSVPLQAYAAAGVELAQRTPADLAADIDGIERMWKEGDGPTSVVMTTAFHWLRKNLHRAFQGQASLAHCDVRFHNILFEGASVTGLLDWELARASYPAEDLGYFRPTACAAMPWSEFKAAYAAGGGPAVPEDQIDFYAIFCAARFAALSASVKRLVLGGQSRDIQLTAVPVHDVYIWMYEISEHLLRVGAYS